MPSMYPTQIKDDLIVRGSGGAQAMIQPTEQIKFQIPAGAAAADYDGVAPIPYPFEVVAVLERHQVAGSDGGAVTAMVKKVPSGTAKAAGTDVLSAGLDLKSVADTNQAGALHGTLANRQGAAGDGLAIVTTGTLTAVDGVVIIVQIKRLS